MAAVLYPIFTIAQLWLYFRFWKFRRSADMRAGGALILQVVIFSLVYDNLIISVGRWLGEGDLLERLSLGRFILRAVFTPLLMVTVVQLAARGAVKWAMKGITRLVIWAAAVSLMGLGVLLNVVAAPELVLETFAGASRYVHVPAVPPIPAILTILVIVVFGVLIWRAAKWPWVFAGGLILLAAVFLPTGLMGPVAGSAAEIFLIWSLIATERRLESPDYSLSESELDSRFSQVTERSKKSS